MAWLKEVKALMAKHPKGKPLTESGAEFPDPVSMEPPPGYRVQPSMFEIIRKLIQDEKVKAALEAEGLETPEEADDFDVDDDIDPSSPYEHNFDHVVDPAELQRLRDAINVRERELASAGRSGTPDLSSSGSSLGGGAAAAGGGSPEAPATPTGAGRSGDR